MTQVGEYAAALAAELVAIDSVNPGLVPGAAGEAAIVEHLRARLDAAGFATHVVGADGRPSLVAIAPGPDRPTVVLNGHLDTVGVEGMPHAFDARVEGDRLLGRGAADMKGGVAALVVAAEALRDDPRVRPVLALVADEEDASVGSEAVVAALPGLGVRPDVCVIAEPTDLVPARSLRGFAVVSVRFRGRAAHSSQPELGVNAVTHLGRLLHAVDQADDSLMVTVARGGRSAFVIPDEAECLVEGRVAPGVSAGSVETDVRALLPEGSDADVELVAHREAWQLDETGPAADLAALLGRPAFDAPYWMEAPLWQELCPTLICGPSGGGLHAVDEWVSLTQVREYAERLVAVLPEWAARAH